MIDLTRLAAMCALIAVFGAVWPSAGAKPAAGLVIREPIVTYWAGPGATMPVTDTTVAQLRAGGWNIGWATSAADLDLYERHGLRAMYVINTPDISDPAQAGALEALVGRVRAHPALFAYFLVDEPGSGAFPKLGKLVAWLRRRDPAHPAYINLLPTYASDAQLQVSDDAAERARVGYPQDFAGIHTDDMTAMRYREHLRQFIDVVKPDLISYDHYHFHAGGGGPQYFLNLALVRSAALAAKKPFVNIIQACDSPAEGWRRPTEDEIRWLTYTSLAYGALGIAHFRYDTGFWEDPKEARTPVPHYWAASRVNRDFLAMAAELKNLTSLGAFHCGAVPLGAEPLPPGSPFAPDPASRAVLLGYFGKAKGHPTHVVVVNLSYSKAAPVTVNGPGAMETFHAPTGAWHAAPGGKRVALDLPAGGGALIRLKAAR